MVTICNTPFEPEWFSSLPVHVQFFAIHEIMKYGVTNLTPLHAQVEYLLDDSTDNSKELLGFPSFLYLLISTLLLQGEIKRAAELINKNHDDLKSLGLIGWNLFIHGKNQDAIISFRADLELLKKLNNLNDAFFTGFEGIIFCLALLQNNQPEDAAEVSQIYHQVQLQKNNIYTSSYRELSLIASDLADHKIDRPDISRSVSSPVNAVHNLFLSLRQCTQKGRLSPKLEAITNDNFNKAKENGFLWLAMEFSEILGRTTDQSPYLETAGDFRLTRSITSITDSIRHKSRWQLALTELGELSTTLAKGTKEGTRRIAWTIAANKDLSSIDIIPREQRLSLTGTWSKGRIISTKRLFHQDELEYISEQDKKIATCISRQRIQNGAITYSFDTRTALLNMADHRNVFMAEPPYLHLKIIKAEPELRVTEGEDNIKLLFFPCSFDERIVILRDDFSTFKVICISENHRKIAEIIGKHGLTIPKKAKKKVMRTIGKTAAHLNVFSDFAEIETPHKKIGADSSIHLQITPADPGFRIAMFVRPFNSKGPYFKPGLGSITIFFDIKNSVLQTTRELDIEEENARKVEEHCPTLALYEDGDREWYIPSPQECLEFLHGVKSLDWVNLEWPQGERLRLKKTAAAGSCQISIKKRNNWFEIDGTLKVDEDTVITLQDLIAEIRKSGSRFIPLKDDDFLALTEELYESLNLIDTAAFADGNECLRINPLTSQSLAQISESGVAVEADRSWHDLLQVLEEADQLEPTVPSTLQAVLRDYQVKGFCWLMRLSYWGAGACLADDMGIGKTIQAMSVILAKASNGPSLVIGPTSVCFNWQDEIKRFAPTLSPKSFNGDNRPAQLASLKPFDVFITSYGLLQQVPEIADIDWQVIVLDEGQAIKNRNTKRSAAAMKLNGRFKIITTGTPIENNLAELWNLFRFINPGLLGTYKQFNDRFATPITKDTDNRQKIKLRALIRPFILRRMKTQVLEELPSRTVVNLYVDFNEDESALYEALRRQSLQRLAPQKDNGQLKIKILAEIMKLRRACCHSQLVLPDSKITSSKLALFEQTIDELLANNHKTLVFSQFVDHLSIIKECLRRKKIRYHYLDGSTPPKARKTRVDAFQAGDGDVFLISLKAGGMGLNLTAANYVIHMDPGWNPAVEDQASDRAHRIGQELPVTIYKFITRNTIEEKIVRLHQQKRELASTLLEDTHEVHKISSQDLLALLKDR